MSEVPPELRLWNLIRGGLGTKALGIAADLRVPDALAAGPQTVDEIAEAVGADADTLHRILRALASDGVFAEEEPGVFRNTDASELLRRDGDVDGRWPEFAHLWGFSCFAAIAELDARSTDVAFARAFGTDFWSWLAANPEERLNFDRAMEGGKAELAERLAGLEWRGNETVVDIGGGTGTLLRELIERRPGLRGVVFDLPKTDRNEKRLGPEITFVAGSFFESVPHGDAYVLSKILHDWDDEQARRILSVVRSAAPDHARVLVSDSVIPAGNDPSGAKWLDILMLVLQRGRERTADEWQTLLEAARFGVDEIDDGLIQASCR
jgi:O-methyltransferase domain/Dimerisation domain